MTSLADHVRTLAPEGLRINLWPTRGGAFQANVLEQGGHGWTVVIDDDPVYAVQEALRQKACGVQSRVIATGDEVERQIDLEDAISEAAGADDLAGMIG